MILSLKVLMIEDSEEDALRIVNELYKGGFEPEDKRVETATQMQAALNESHWDLILSDFDLPSFSGPEALALFKKSKLDIPFIIVSGAIGDAKAVDSLKAGASDFIRKDNLVRLVPAIRRELKDYQIRVEKKRAIDELKESEERYRVIFHGANEGILIVEIATRSFLYFNDAICRMFGYTADEFKELKFCDIHPEETSAANQANFLLQTSDTKPFASDVPCLQKDGSIIYTNINTTPLTINNKECLVGFFTNITENKKAVLALRESEKRFRAIATTANDGVVMIDQDGLVSFWNPAAERLFGYLQEEVMGVELHKLITTEDNYTEFRKGFTKFSKTGKGNIIGKTLELTAKTKDGSKLPVELSVASIKMQNVWHAVGIIRDVRERKNLEVELRQAQKLESIGTLAAGIAHEINTPTQYIGNNLRFLREEFDNLSVLFNMLGKLKNTTGDYTDINESVKEVVEAYDDADVEFLQDEIPKAIDQSISGVDNVTRIVKAMRSFAHPGYKEKDMVDIHSAIENTITVSKNEWKYVADMDLDFDNTIPMIPCYLGEFNQVILNLIINATHAIQQAAETRKANLLTDEGETNVDQPFNMGKITITTLNRDKFVKITISDTGSGIPEAVQDRIFEPFFTTKDVGKGTGQGLTLAYNVIVEKHKGTLTFKTKEGEGTTFIITLPYEVA